MAIAKVIKGATRMVEKTVVVEEKQPDKVLLELSQNEVNVLRFILGQRYATTTLDAHLSTAGIYRALKEFSTCKLSDEYKIKSSWNGWEIVRKAKDDC